MDYSNKLKAFDSVITAQDKLDAMEAVEISRPTLDKYLQGDVVKLETATKLIEFFEGRISQRIEELQRVNVM